MMFTENLYFLGLSVSTTGKFKNKLQNKQCCECMHSSKRTPVNFLVITITLDHRVPISSKVTFYNIVLTYLLALVTLHGKSLVEF